ncbi:hypothetical protein [Fictibacillus sp. S7]|uniref:hypothetical protein n=1 Tax=Fictibacillus sp. S7 TaxID=2212476 RepID=UPI0019D6D447
MGEMKLSVKIIIGLVLGVFVGLVLNLAFPDAFGGLDKYVLTPIGQMFLKLIKMLVVRAKKEDGAQALNGLGVIFSC